MTTFFSLMIFPIACEVPDADRARFECQRVGVDRIERLQRRLIALNLVPNSLLTGIAPTRVAPDFGLAAQPFGGVIEHFDQVVDAEACRTPCRAREPRWIIRLFHLDHLTTGVGEQG